MKATLPRPSVAGKAMNAKRSMLWHAPQRALEGPSVSTWKGREPEAETSLTRRAYQKPDLARKEMTAVAGGTCIVAAYAPPDPPNAPSAPAIERSMRRMALE